MNAGYVFRAAIAALLFLILAPVCGYAACTTIGGAALVNFQLPASILLEPDTPVGTVVYEQEQFSQTINIDCAGSTGNIWAGYISLTDADARDDVLKGVYQTNVPGMGIRMAETSEGTASFVEDNIVTPMHFVGYGGGGSVGTMIFHSIFQLVVTGKIEEGYLDTSRLTAQEKYGDATIAEMRVSPASIHIMTNTCNLVDKNIYVPLKTIQTNDFEGQHSDILTDDGFKIEIADCRAGTQIDLRMTSTGSTGVTDGNILSIASGDTAARGVGIQILDEKNNVLSFDRSYTALNSTRANEVAAIPLKARYVKTGDVKAGKVDAVATFDVFYR